MVFKKFFAYVRLETWHILHAPNASWLAYYGFAHFGMKLVKVLNY